MRYAGAIFFAVAVAQAGGLVASARANECPGHPGALGTSRVLVIHPGEYSKLGTLQYPETLPLADKEVVLTFDDGPLPPASNEVLDTLAAQCVKATFFLVGEMAHSFPSVVRRIHEEGHTIGTHSYNHPVRFDKLPPEKLRWQIDQGIAEVTTALGDPDALAPFFRIPGLGRSEEVEHELTERSLITFSVDAVADDWFHRIRPADIISRAMSRLERRGGGILLLHDIHKTTAAALPGLLKELKEKGFQIVQVIYDNSPQTEIAGEPKVEARAEPKIELKAESNIESKAESKAAPNIESKAEAKAASKTEPKIESKGGPRTAHKKWMVAISMAGQLVMDDSDVSPRWPEADASLTSDVTALPAPDADVFDTGYPVGGLGKLATGGRGDAPWPSAPHTVSPSAEAPAPNLQDIGVPLEKRQVVGEVLELRPSVGITGAN